MLFMQFCSCNNPFPVYEMIDIPTMDSSNNTNDHTTDNDKHQWKVANEENTYQPLIPVSPNEDVTTSTEYQSLTRINTASGDHTTENTEHQQREYQSDTATVAARHPTPHQPSVPTTSAQANPDNIVQETNEENTYQSLISVRPNQDTTSTEYQSLTWITGNAEKDDDSPPPLPPKPK